MYEHTGGDHRTHGGTNRRTHGGTFGGTHGRADRRPHRRADHRSLCCVSRTVGLGTGVGLGRTLGLGGTVGLGSGLRRDQHTRHTQHALARRHHADLAPGGLRNVQPDHQLRVDVQTPSSTVLPDPNDGLVLPGDLADSWSTTDAQNYTFKLHQGVKWQDGTPFTIDDIIWTINESQKWSPGRYKNTAWDAVKGGKAVRDGTAQTGHGRREGRRQHAPDHPREPGLQLATRTCPTTTRRSCRSTS